MIKTSIKVALASVLLMGVANADYGTVNGETITKDEVSQTIGQPGLEFNTLNADMKKRVLDMVVDRKLLSQHAAK
nr:hypothetical protein [Campylobacterota bacterium]